MSARALPQVSPWFARMFTRYSRWHVRRHFHAVRVLRSALPAGDFSERPLVVYLNHAAWWDPLVALLLAEKYFPDRTCFAPIAAEHLERYRFFKQLGFYGVKEGGALGFLRTTCALLETKSHAVWLTPQGRFMDVRERPLRFAPGLGALAQRAPHAAFLPLAIDYTFWTEPRPEILVAFGETIVPSERPRAANEDWNAVLESALAAAQDALAANACLRVPADWVPLEEGATGVNSIYDAWRWLRARVTGEEFTREHRAEGVK